MIFQEIRVEVTITDENGRKTNTHVDVTILAGSFDAGSVIRELKRNYQNCTVVINDILWRTR